MTTRTSPRIPEWLAPTGLLILAIVPMLGGFSRLTELAGGAEITAQNERFFDSPLPVIIHIVAATVYFVLGAFQFVPSIRARGGYHRAAGRVLAPAGLLTALTGLWMTVFYDAPNDDFGVLITLRLVFGVAMVASIALGVWFITRRDIRRHSAWMTRGYAIGIAAGTQVLTTLPWVLLIGEPDRLTSAILLGAGWVINVIVAEIVIWRRAHRPRRTGNVARPTAPVSTSDALV